MKNEFRANWVERSFSGLIAIIAAGLSVYFVYRFLSDLFSKGLGGALEINTLWGLVLCWGTVGLCLFITNPHLRFDGSKITFRGVWKKWTIEYSEIDHYTHTAEKWTLYLSRGNKVSLWAPLDDWSDASRTYSAIQEILEAHLGPPVPSKSQRRYQRIKGWFARKSDS